MLRKHNLWIFEAYDSSNANEFLDKNTKKDPMVSQEIDKYVYDKIFSKNRNNIVNNVKNKNDFLKKLISTSNTVDVLKSNDNLKEKNLITKKINEFDV